MPMVSSVIASDSTTRMNFTDVRGANIVKTSEVRPEERYEHTLLFLVDVDNYVRFESSI